MTQEAIIKLNFATQSTAVVNGVPLGFSAGSDGATWVYADYSYRVGKTPPADLAAMASYAYTSESKLIAEDDYVAFSNGRGSYVLMKINDAQSLHHGDSLNGVVATHAAYTAAAPTVAGFSPVAGLVGVPVDSNMTVTFSEAIQRGTGAIVLKDAAGVAVETYDAATSASLAIAGATMTIDPTAVLAYGMRYTLELAAGSVKGMAGNAYAGAAHNSFTTATSPNTSNLATQLNFDVQKTISIDGVPIRFSIGDQASTWVYGHASYRVGTSAPADLSSLNNYTYTTEAKLVSEGEYIAIDGGNHAYALIQIVDAQSMAFGSSMNGVLFNSSTFHADVGDTTAPTLIDHIPAPGASHVAPGSDIILTFSEPIERGSGAVTLKDATGSLVASYDAATSGKLHFSGATLTIAPGNDLAYSGSYTLELAAGAVKDAAGNNFIASSPYTFQTKAAPVISTGTAGDDQFSATPGDDAIDGGAGTDILVYAGAQHRYSVQQSGAGFVVTENSGTGGADTLVNIERLQFSDGNIALDINGVAGQLYRIYQAAFNRAPDSAGAGYWLAQLDRGLGPTELAAAFVASNEFQDHYGTSADHHQLVSKLYQNVLHREGQAAEIGYWSGVLDAKAASIADVLVGFSESAENRGAVAQVIGNGFAYTPYG